MGGSVEDRLLECLCHDRALGQAPGITSAPAWARQPTPKRARGHGRTGTISGGARIFRIRSFSDMSDHLRW